MTEMDQRKGMTKEKRKISGKNSTTVSVAGPLLLISRLFGRLLGVKLVIELDIYVTWIPLMMSLKGGTGPSTFQNVTMY